MQKNAADVQGRGGAFVECGGVKGVVGVTAWRVWVVWRVWRILVMWLLVCRCGCRSGVQSTQGICSGQLKLKLLCEMRMLVALVPVPETGVKMGFRNATICLYHVRQSRAVADISLFFRSRSVAGNASLARR